MQVLEELRAQVEQEPAGDPLGEVGVEEADDPRHDREAEIRRGDRDEGAEVARDEDVVDQPLVEQDGDGVDERADGDEQQRETDPTAVRPGIRPEPANDLPQR